MNKSQFKSELAALKKAGVAVRKSLRAAAPVAFKKRIGPWYIPAHVGEEAPLVPLFVASCNAKGVVVTDDGDVTWTVPWAKVPLETATKILGHIAH